MGVRLDAGTSAETISQLGDARSEESKGRSQDYPDLSPEAFSDPLLSTRKHGTAFPRPKTVPGP